MALGWFGGSKEASLGELIAAKKYKKAIEVLRAQFRDGARDPRLRLQLADILVLAGRAKEAVPILSGLADEYAREGYAAKAIAVLKKLQKIAPGKSDVERRLAELLHRRIGSSAAPRPPAEALEPRGLELGMEEVASGATGEIGIGEAAEIGIGDSVAPEATSVAASPAPAGAPAPVAAPAPPPAEETAESEQDFFSTLQDIVEAGEAAAAEPAAPSAAKEVPRPAPSPLFSGFSEDELAAVIARFRLVAFEPGDIVVSEGQPGDSLFVLTTGALKAFVRDQARRNVPVRDMPEGSFFGEVSILSGKPRTATVTCASHCELLELDRAALDEIAAEHPRVREVIQETYQSRAGSLEEMLAREGWDGPPPPAPKAP
jgi:hypothetical protein